MSSDAAQCRDREALIDAFARGGRLKYVFFWGHTASTEREVGKECLSQWYPAPFVADGVNYPTAEHYMMAEKARLFGDRKAEEKILNAGSPAEAKAAGRAISPFDEAIWTAHRMEIVVRGNLAKFGQHEALRAFLLGTGNRVLVEASPKDRIWGIGLAADDEKAGNPTLWRGLNLLGFALMEVRDRLNGESK